MKPKKMSSHSVEPISIPEFYENKNVFITGATGFIGRLLVQKLLRDCPGIRNVYVLLRPKKGKNVQERIKDITDIPVFDQIRKDNIEALDKIIAVEGNVEEVNFGMSEEDRQTIIDNVTIIFHLAASVRFSDSLKKAILNNTRSAREAAVLATQLKKIDAFVDTSTGYCNCDRLVIEEKLYPAKMDWRELIQIAEEGDEETVQYLTQKIIHPMPNTYTFTKSIGEHAVADISRGKIPTVIVRPTIVKPTHSDPIPGWVDNLNGSIGLILGIGKGITRSLYGDGSAVFDQVFADNVVKAMIIASWRKALSGDVDEVTIYNISSDLNFEFRIEKEIGNDYARKYPFSTYLWPPKVDLYSNFYQYYFFVILTHILPAIIVDSVLLITKRKPILWKIQRNMYLANVHLFYFMTNSWTFINNNYKQLMNCLTEEDRDNFEIVYYGPKPKMKDVMHYMMTQYENSRNYLLNEPTSIGSSPVTYQRLLYIQKVWKTFWLGLALYYIFVKYQFLTIVTNGTYNYFAK